MVVVPGTQGSTIGDLRPDRDIEFDGRIDEVQISNVVRSAAWQTATYKNQATTSDFYSVGSPQTDNVRTFADGSVTATGDVNLVSGKWTGFADRQRASHRWIA